MMNKDILLADVLVPLPLSNPFTYQVPSRLKVHIRPGLVAVVPFARRLLAGFIVRIKPKDNGNYRELLYILHEGPAIDRSMYTFLKWVSWYYYAPLGDVVKMAVPKDVLSSIRYTLRITKHNPPPLNEIESRAFSYLRENEECDLISLCAKVPGLTQSQILSLLERRVLSIRANMPILSPKGDSDYMVYIAGSYDAKSLDRAPKQKALFDMLRSEGPLTKGRIIQKVPRSWPFIKRMEQKGIVRIEERDASFFSPHSHTREPSQRIRLSHDQTKAFLKVLNAVDKGGFKVFLLHGITGSGKTEIYLRAVDRALRKGGGAIVLVPEIALTPQLGERFRSRFPGRVAVFHSGLSRTERRGQWFRLKSGAARVVLGTRSAVFVPVKDLKMVIVDEEHEDSYKQGARIRYGGRDLALVRAKQSQSLVILGSATPSLESYHNSMTKKYHYLYLGERVGYSRMPRIEIVDLRKSIKGFGKNTISPQLREAMNDALKRKEQVILFLNRRGYAPICLCRDCGFIYRCPHCNISLTYHHDSKRLLCHYCSYSIHPHSLCPSCRGHYMKMVGTGTQRLEKEVKALFPEARIGRMDRDTTRRKGALREFLDAFWRGDIDIMMGTQILAKGHHFPGVTLVGVVLADISINLPDFRSAERTFQILTQVAGRAGRGKTRGRVVIQTFSPDNYCLRFAITMDFKGFSEEELKLRKELNFPPFTRMANVLVSGSNLTDIEKTAANLRDITTNITSIKDNLAEVLGPAPAPLERIRGRYRWQMLIRSKNLKGLRATLDALKAEIERMRIPSGIRIRFDMDPKSLM